MTSVMMEMLRTVFPAAGCGGAAAGVGAAAAAVGEARGALEEAAAWRRGMLSSHALRCVQQAPSWRKQSTEMQKRTRDRVLNRK